MTLDAELSEILISCNSFAKSRGFEFITPELVVFIGLKKESQSIIDLMYETNADDFGVKDGLLDYLEKNLPPDSAEYGDSPLEVPTSVAFDEIMETAAQAVSSAGKNTITVGQFMIAAIQHEKTFVSYILRKNGMSAESLMQAVTSLDETLDIDDMNYFMAQEEEPEKKKNILERNTRNLTEAARKGELDKVIGREEELQRTIEILCRRTKNNPIHVGDAGVGKTSITEGLAQKIVEGKVPDYLKDAEIFSLEMGSLIAGTKFRGDFENKIKGIVENLQKRKKAILFIDEIHTMVGAGTSGNSGGLDAANILKPALSKGNLRCIGSTTFEDYKKTFEADRALARRFQKIDINEVSRNQCVEILKGLAPKYAEYHGVKYSPESLEEAVDLSIQYIPDKRLPDKAIDIIDEAGVYAKLHKKTKSIPQVTVNDIRKMVSKTSGVPLENITQKEKDRFAGLEENIKKEIYGQDDAVHSLCVAVKKSRAGFRNMEKPESSFLFVGPTGVGKTEVAKVLSRILDEQLIRFDMSEYQEAYSISKLIGSAPGYVGYENGGLLTDSVRKNPRSIILFDEIEKAHKDIYNTLLQVLDYGTLTDSQGRKADFRNCLIIFTSNAGASEMGKQATGFATQSSSDNDKFILKEALEKTFTPEFRNRLDKTIDFQSLTRENARMIARKAVSKISQRLEKKNITLEASEGVLDYICDNGMSKEFGARNIMRFAEDEISSPLVDEILFGNISSGTKIKFEIIDGKLTWNKI